MSLSETVTRFNMLYLGDSLLEQMVFDVGKAECKMRFNSASVLKKEQGDIFDPEVRFEPAELTLVGVLSVSFVDGPYQLNSTVVGFGASTAADGTHVQFTFQLTGGFDAASFMATICFVADGFTLGSATAA